MTPFSPPWSIGRSLLSVALCLMLCLSATQGCSTFTAEEPPIPDSTFSTVLIELQLISGQLRQGLNPTTRLRDSVFSHYGVQEEDFKATLRHYSRRPSEFKSLYDGVVDTLRALEQETERAFETDTSADASP